MISTQLPRHKIGEIKTIRMLRGSLLSDIIEIMSDVDKEQLRNYVRGCIPVDWKHELLACQSIADIFYFLGEKSTLFDITYLEGVVEHFDNDRARTNIEQYKEKLNRFFKKVPSHLLSSDLQIQSSPLLCETILINVDKNIEELLTIAFEQFGPKINVIVVKKANSFIIVCSFPLSWSQELIEKALKNIDVLKKRGVYQLIVGYCTVYSHVRVSKVRTSH